MDFHLISAVHKTAQHQLHVYIQLWSRAQHLNHSFPVDELVMLKDSISSV